MSPRPGSGRLSPAHLRLAGMLADTDLSVEKLAPKFGTTPAALRREQSKVYRRYGVQSRQGLRAAMLALELAPVGAR